MSNTFSPSEARKPTGNAKLTRTSSIINGPTSIFEPIRSDSIRVISREKCSKKRSAEWLPSIMVPSWPGDAVSNAPISQCDSSTGEVAVAQANLESPNPYWGVVEPFPLEPREIAPPPISPPCRSYTTSFRPLSPLIEEDSVLEAESADPPSSSVQSGVLESSVLDDDGWSHTCELGSSASSASSSGQTADLGMEPSLKGMKSANVSNTSGNSAEDWDQFVLVEPIQNKARSRGSSGSSTPVPFRSHVPVVDGPDERLQKRLKNWPRYLQVLLQA